MHNMLSFLGKNTDADPVYFDVAGKLRMTFGNPLIVALLYGSSCKGKKTETSNCWLPEVSKRLQRWWQQEIKEKAKGKTTCFRNHWGISTGIGLDSFHCQCRKRIGSRVDTPQPLTDWNPWVVLFNSLDASEEVKRVGEMIIELKETRNFIYILKIKQFWVQNNANSNTLIPHRLYILIIYIGWVPETL